MHKLAELPITYDELIDEAQKIYGKNLDKQ